MDLIERMDLEKIKNVFGHFEWIVADFDVELLNSGHINSTYCITNNQKKYILQRINTSVFKNPDLIGHAIQEVADYLKKKEYPHPIMTPLRFSTNEILFENEWRLFDFFENTLTFEKVQSSSQAYEAAKFLSEFHFYLRDFNSSHLKESFPGFLDFEERFRHFENALNGASTERLNNAQTEIDFIAAHRFLLDSWLAIRPELPTRLIHADPKISNFLFDSRSHSEIVALIDWDTLMNGSLLYDFGDMVRSYTHLKEEDDPEIGNNFSSENFKALKKGFLFHLKSDLSKVEINAMDLAAQVVIYIQAVRFLTDYLNEDVYYTIHYPEQNLNRTKSQIQLLTAIEKYLQ